ncbi:LGFP repeat-containing protein [Piscinibacter terrae]|nr:hypothetical protein [Albitalea terrae]
MATSFTTARTAATKVPLAHADLLNESLTTTVQSRFNGVLEGLHKAAIAIEQKRIALGGATGQSIGHVDFGAGDGYFCRFQNGIIYLLPPAAPCWVHGSILDKYIAQGAERGPLGYPTTDELATPAGSGRYNHFQRGSIYWSYVSGAHIVAGAIRDRWAVLGWEQSWLGLPTSDEKDYADGGRVSEFQHGNIYWWDDTGAIDLGDVAVRYKGLYCFGETSGAGSDEPYLIFGVVPPPPYRAAASLTQIYDDVDDGDSRPDTVELYRGIPGGFAISFSLFEHDTDDRDKYLGLVKQAVALAGKGVAAGCGGLLGPDAAKVCESVWGALATDLAKAANDVLGTGDDFIAASGFALSAKEMVLLANVPRQNFWGIEYHRESALLSDGDASYKAYLDVVRV